MTQQKTDGLAALSYRQSVRRLKVRQGVLSQGPLGLERDGLLVGLNWSGARATRYDVLPSCCPVILRMGDMENETCLESGKATMRLATDRILHLVG